MALIIDGYNLLYASGVSGGGTGRKQFERSRLALLNFLVESLPPDELQHTTVVFDAAGAPPGLPHVLHHRGLTVRFAADYDDADALVEELIAADTSPRRLTVVSSDHRLQRAAARRRARSVDSDRWYSETRQRRAARSRSAPPGPPPPDKPLLTGSDEEIAYWLRQFREVLEDELAPGVTRPALSKANPSGATAAPADPALTPEALTKDAPPTADPADVGPSTSAGAKRPRRRAKPSRRPPRIDEGPIFPPGYGEI